MSEFESSPWPVPVAVEQQPVPPVPEQRTGGSSVTFESPIAREPAPAVDPAPVTAPPAFSAPPSYPSGYPAGPVPAMTPWQPAWPPPAWPQPAPKRRFGAGALVLVAVLTAIVCGTAGVVTGVAIKTATSTTAAGIQLPTLVPTPEDSTPGTAPSSAAGAALLARIVPAPPGAREFAMTNAPGGVLDLDQNVKQFFSTGPTEAGILRQEGFVVAAATDYQRTDGLQILTHLTQFATQDGAQSYFLQRRAAWTRDADVTGSFTVPGGGVGYEKHALDKLGNRRTVMYERIGDIVVALDVYTAGTFNRSVDLAIMAVQMRKLS